MNRDLNMPYEMIYDSRLQIRRPILHVDYDELESDVQAEFELLCQQVCACIPEQIKCFEIEYLMTFDSLKEVEDEKLFFAINEQLNDLSSRISDLNILFLHIEGSFVTQSVHS
ncbi:hypothetical protein SAMN04487866_12029 [Thermoactinomyces sp. DSM 45891]|uniref:hypothetical protein n=1 Tax=Thermoactinomyces sp. DSM 45891 TaxID=1761907 RepID=UPI0009168540|nr:hypothetical protein [Thermoactinomyces sp. DSM 45891]SFX72971.1 hypothetical protein SAMN04487866_12029 [Thermoactinomyces sp. DSM 45891]